MVFENHKEKGKRERRLSNMKDFYEKERCGP
jgi:hypothetical protein